MPSSSSPPPQRPQASSGHPESSTPGGALTRPALWSSESELFSEQNVSLADFFAQALEGAMALTHADGGELAMLDDTRQVLVLRARHTHPRVDPTALGPMGRPSRASQPSASHPAYSAAQSSFGGIPTRRSDPGAGQSYAGVEDESGQIEIQSTVLLPATMISRTYRRGERLIGQCWERGEPLMMTHDQCRRLPAGSAPPDPDAPHHLAAPIRRPLSLATLYPNTDILGVISLFNRDPLWSFTSRDVEQLTLHADRVARALRAADLARQNQSQAELLDLLASEASNPDAHFSLYPRLRDVVRRLIDAPTFAVLLYDQHTDTVSFELAERDNQPVPGGDFPAKALPPWWSVVRAGRDLRVSAPEERAAHPELCALGWGSDQPVASIMAAPLITGNTLIGAIVAGSPRLDVYAPEHARAFATIARSSAIVVQNMRLSRERSLALEKTRAKQEQLAALNNAMLAVNDELDPDKTLSSLVTQASHLTQATHCLALIYESKTPPARFEGRFVCAKSGHEATPVSELTIPGEWRRLDQMLLGESFAFLDDLDGEWADESPVGRLLAERQIRAALVVPIQKDETLLGALMVYTPGQRHHFNPDETILLRGLVSQAANALTNANLYQEQHILNFQLREMLERQKIVDQMKEDFILMISHEFRTPVTAIDGYVTLIGRHGHKLEQEKLDTFASEIRQATGQLMGMISKLSDAYKLSNEPVHAPRPVDLRHEAEVAIGLLAPEDKARLMLRTPDGLWALADNERLISVFTNLLSNAIKYSPSDKPVQITAQAVARETLAAQGRPHALLDGAPEQWAVVGVRDHGPGITEEDQRKLFLKFGRLPRSLTTSVRGTGLGLWICHQNVTTMGGDIWVESEYGKGSLFQFSLPYAVPPDEAR
ncbi:MAG TPA: GAF domain-containing protein [Ktedonobacterales bacterium]|nr:GAF domain-containing protein [Ktedonobacterales bacterium]